MLCREVLKRQQFFTVLLQTLHRFRVLQFVYFLELSEGSLCIVLGFGLPDVRQHLFHFRLNGLRHVVQGTGLSWVAHSSR